VGKKKHETTAGTPAILAVKKAGVAYEIHTYDHDPRESHHVGFGREAAAQLGLEPAAVFKTLMIQVDGHLACAVVPVTGSLSLKAAAQALGGKKAQMADPAEAEKATGYVVGGISPLGQKKRHPTLIDQSAEGLAMVYVSGGGRGLNIGIGPADLARLTGARFAPIAAD
jgi:Cys-tRNA(Pro)/Cys-tRNA(Cys) deacylase